MLTYRIYKAECILSHPESSTKAKLIQLALREPSEQHTSKNEEPRKKDEIAEILESTSYTEISMDLFPDNSPTKKRRTMP